MIVQQRLLGLAEGSSHMGRGEGSQKKSSLKRGEDSYKKSSLFDSFSRLKRKATSERYVREIE